MLTEPFPTGRSSRVGQKWRRPDENIYENLRQYDLGHLFLDCLVADASQHSLWRHQPLFDAIITDRTWDADNLYVTPELVYIEIRHLDVLHFVTEECNRLANSCTAKCGCIVLMLSHYLSCLGAIICDY